VCRQSSSSAFPGRTVPCAREFQIGDHGRVDDIEGVVGLVDKDGLAARGRHDELATVDRNRLAVRQMHDERTKRLGVINRAKLLDCHWSLPFSGGRRLKPSSAHDPNLTMTRAALAKALAILDIAWQREAVGIMLAGENPPRTGDEMA